MAHVDEVMRDLDSHFGRGTDKDEIRRLINNALSVAKDTGKSEGKAAEEARERDDYTRRMWDRAIEGRVASFVTLLGEQVPITSMLRAAKVAPAVEAGSWSRDVTSTILNADRQAAQDEVDRLNRAPSTGSNGGRRSSSRGMDPVVAFVLGAALF